MREIKCTGLDHQSVAKYPFTISSHSSFCHRSFPVDNSHLSCFRLCTAILSRLIRDPYVSWINFPTLLTGLFQSPIPEPSHAFNHLHFSPILVHFTMVRQRFVRNKCLFNLQTFPLEGIWKLQEGGLASPLLLLAALECKTVLVVTVDWFGQQTNHGLCYVVEMLLFSSFHSDTVSSLTASYRPTAALD